MLEWKEVAFVGDYCWQEAAGFTVNDALGGFTQFDIQVHEGTWHDPEGAPWDGSWTVINVQIDEHPWCVDEGPFKSREFAKAMAEQLLREFAQGILKEIDDEQG
jgi:hypothetical protein